MPASTNLSDARASWPIPPTEAPKVIKTEEVEKKAPPRLATIPCTLVLNKPQSNKPAEEECRSVDGDHIAPSMQNPLLRQKRQKTGMVRQDNQQRNYYPQSSRYSPVYDIPDMFSQQLKLEREWNEKMKQLNNKYNLDYYSSSESDSEFELEHKYETLI